MSVHLGSGTVVCIPRRRAGKCSAGHAVHAEGFKEDFERGDLMVECRECGAWVLPTWDPLPTPSFFTLESVKEIRMDLASAPDETVVAFVDEIEDGREIALDITFELIDEKKFIRE